MPDFEFFNCLELCERDALVRCSFIESNEVAVAGAIQALELVKDDVEHGEGI